MNSKTKIVVFSVLGIAVATVTVLYLSGKLFTGGKAEAGEVEMNGTPIVYRKPLGEGEIPLPDGKGDPGLRITEETRKGLALELKSVKAAVEKRALPPQVGTINYDNETMFQIKPRFPGELVSLMKIDEEVIVDGSPRKVKRFIKFGDTVNQGDELAVFWSVTLGTQKAAYVDAISALRLSQETLDRQREVYLEGALSLSALRVAERQVRGDNLAMLTAERTLRMWKLTDKQIEELRDEASEIIDSRLFEPTGRISKIDGAGVTFLLNTDGKQGKVYKIAKDCKFSQTFKKNGKDEKEEIKGGLKADVFQKLGKAGLGATVVMNAKGEAAEVIIAKERDVVAEVERWSRVAVTVPWFDESNKERRLTILEKNTHIGDIVDNTNFGTTLFKVADMSRLQIWVHPPEEYLPILRKGMEKNGKGNGKMKWRIHFQADPDKPLDLDIDRIAPSYEPTQHNPMVIGFLDSKDRHHLVGQALTATIYVDPEKDTVEIPTDALNEIKGQSFVFVRDDKDKNEYSCRRVSVVQRFKDFTTVRSELTDELKKFSEQEVKQGRWPLRPLRPNENVVTRGVVEMTTALENLLTKQRAKEVAQ